jgi:hypothetical protein
MQQLVKPAPRGVVLILLLGVLWLLVETGTSTLLAWTERCSPVERIPALLASYLLTWWLARRATTRRGRRAALLAGSIATAAIFDLGFLVLLLAWICVLHAILFSRARRRVVLAIAYVAGSYVVLGLLCHRELFPDQSTTVLRWGYLFAVAITFRVAWLLHQVHVQGTAHLPLVDVVLYFVFAPFFVIVPYMIAIPRCDRFCAGLDRHDTAIELSGLRMIAWGCVLSLAAAGIRELYDPEGHAATAVIDHGYAAAFVHGFAWYFGAAVLGATAIAAILVGLVRVLGIDLGPSFQRPLASRSVSEWWRRWNTHFRDLLVDLFYYPIVMRLRRKPVRATVLGCVSVFLVGSVVFHFPKYYFMHGRLSVQLGLVGESVVMCAVVAMWLVREQRRPRPAPRTASRFRRLGSIAATLLVVYLAVVIVNRGIQHFVLPHDLTPERTCHGFAEP